MAKSTEPSIFVHISQGSDSLCIVPHPDAKLIVSFLIFHRRQGQGNRLFSPADLQCYRFSAKICKILQKILLALDPVLIKSHNIISRLYNVPGRFFHLTTFRKDLACINDQNSFRLHINTYCISACIYFFCSYIFYLHILKRDHSQESAVQLIAVFS